MLVKSYLVFPKEKQFSPIYSWLRTFPQCDLSVPDNNKEVIVMVLESDDQGAEDQILQKIHQNKYLDHMVLVSSFNESEN